MAKKKIPAGEKKINEKLQDENTGTIQDIVKTEGPDNNLNEESMEIHRTRIRGIQLGFKEYLFEFLMLFLAVSAGFLVENMRENYTERHKEHQYMESLVRDLITDTLDLHQTILNVETQIKGIDSLGQVLLKDNNLNAGLIFYYSINYTNTLYLFQKTDRTITQLRNSGNLRLIHSQAVSDSIVSYYGSVAGIDLNSEFNLKIFDRLIESRKLLFNYKVLNYISSLEDLRNDKKFKLFNSDPVLLNSYYTDILTLRSITINYNENLKNLKNQGTRLLDFLKEEYKLE